MLADIGLSVVRLNYSGPGPWSGAVSFCRITPARKRRLSGLRHATAVSGTK